MDEKLHKMLIKSMLCTKKRFQLCIKVLLIVSIIGVYFIVLLRESFAAWESSSLSSITTTSVGLTKVKNVLDPNRDEKYLANRLHYKRHKYREFGGGGGDGGGVGNDVGRNKSIFIASHSTHFPQTTTTTSTTVNPMYEYSEEKNAMAEHDFHRRRDQLWKMCSKYEFIDRYPPNAWEFFISPGHGIAWCNVFKAASSTWMYYFNILGGYDVKFLQRTKASPLELARKRFPRPTAPELSEALTSSLSFLIVREPFERLLSAYRNKLEFHRNKYYKILGDQIIKEYRKGNKHKPPGPTFKEFIRFVIDSHKTGRRFDEHWSPIYSFCTPCSINYTLIAKVETFQRDTEYIIRQAGLETLLLNKLPSGKKIRSISNESARQTAKLINKYFSQIDDILLAGLLDIYNADFDLFGYNSTKYFDIVKMNKPPPLLPLNVTTTTSTTVAEANG